MVWYELKMAGGGRKALIDFYRQLDVEGLQSYHHFWNEPWWPDEYVVRLHVEDDYKISADDHDAIYSIDVWDSSEDEEHFGNFWPAVADFFCDASRIPDVDREHALVTKLVHCFLNSRGMEPRDEAKWAAKFLWNRLTINIRWRLYLRKRWERRQSAKVEAAA